MSSLSSTYITSPTNETEECAKLSIDDIRETFVLFDVAIIGQQYTFTFWVRSDADGSIDIDGTTIQTSSTWTKYTNTYQAVNTNIIFTFGMSGTYYIYHPQLEIGNIPTDWSRAPEDVEEATENAQSSANTAQGTADDAANRVGAAEAELKILSDMISSLVTDANGTSLMTQTGSGWTFNIGGMQSNINTIAEGLGTLKNDYGDTDAVVKRLNDSVKNLEDTLEYVRIGVFQDEPCIELGESDSDFKLLITNTRIMFMEGSDTPTYISNKTLNTDKIRVYSEFQQGGFVWSKRSNGNVGLIWKGDD